MYWIAARCVYLFSGMLLCVTASVAFAHSNAVSSDKPASGPSLTHALSFCRRAQGWLDVSPVFLNYVYDILSKDDDWSDKERDFLRQLYAQGFGDSLGVFTQLLNKQQLRRYQTTIADGHTVCPILLSRMDAEALILQLGASYAPRVMRLAFEDCKGQNRQANFSDQVMHHCACVLTGACDQVGVFDRLRIRNTIKSHDKVFMHRESVSTVDQDRLQALVSKHPLHGNS